jgi:hypothetical protein
MRDGISPIRRIGAGFWPRGRSQFRESDSCAGLGEVLVDVGVGTAARDLGDLAVAEASDEEGEIVALAGGELSEDAQGFAGFKRALDHFRAGDDLLPAHDRRDRLEVRVASFDRRQAVGLVNCDDAEPGEDGAALGLFRSRMAQAFWQASSMSSRGALTAWATARCRSR